MGPVICERDPRRPRGRRISPVEPLPLPCGPHPPPCPPPSATQARPAHDSLARLASFPFFPFHSSRCSHPFPHSESSRPLHASDQIRASRGGRLPPSARVLLSRRRRRSREMAVERTVPGAAGRTVLVTGGAGYIGSHAVLQLLLAGFRAVVVDNLNNSSELAVRRIAALAGDHSRNLSFHKIDLRDKGALERVFASTRFDAVVHFAGLKAVGESVQKPLLYYDNNVIGTINLLEVMSAYGCKKLVFSSSAAVYGSPKNSPCTEEFPLTPNNPYGKTKLVVEDICRDIYRTDPEWKIILLRYFNPVGAHPSGYLGEDPCGIPNNLMPFVQQVAVGRRSALTILGNDYATRDGTGVRDYIHVVDLADGHIAALQKLFENSNIGCEAYNLGTGKGTSVLEIVKAFEKASGKKIPLIIGPRRPGDAEILFSSTAKAERELNWKAKYGIEEMCRDQWNWASKNPYGYGSPDSTKQNGHHAYGSTDSTKQNGHHIYGSADSKQNGHNGYGPADSTKQNGNGHLH